MTVYFSGYCVGGSNGEGPYLKAEEKLEMVSKIRSMIGKDRLLIAGTTCECKREIYPFVIRVKFLNCVTPIKKYLNRYLIFDILMIFNQKVQIVDVI